VLSAKEKERRSSVVYRYKRRKTVDLYAKETEGKLHVDCQSRSPKPSTSVEPSSSAWGQARPTGAGEANGGGKPLASSPCPPAPKSKEATGPNLVNSRICQTAIMHTVISNSLKRGEGMFSFRLTMLALGTFGTSRVYEENAMTKAMTIRRR
jgi:hypothetical protein